MQLRHSHVLNDTNHDTRVEHLTKRYGERVSGVRRLRSLLLLAAAAAGLAVTLFYVSRPQPAPVTEPRPFVWEFDMTELVRMEIALPRAGLRERWRQGDDRQWYFDDERGRPVNADRWGGGIALLVSGPGANRRIAEDAADEQLQRFGLTEPQMTLRLTLTGGALVEVIVGDATPDGRSYYVKEATARSVYTVDHTWYGVLERLVTDPPYPPPNAD